MAKQENNLPAKQERENPLVLMKRQLEDRTAEFQNALPAHMPVARFQRVVMTAVQNNPALVTADRQTFFNSCMRAAQDGLLPDGREGAIVIYNTKVKFTNDKGRQEEKWIDAAQWMPMIFGILKKIRNSGQLKSIVARVVYEGDRFRYWIDDTGEHVEYEPADNPNRDVIRRVFAMAQTHDGATYVEPMTVDEVEKVRQVSRAKDAASGPWVKWWDQMACKTVLRRLAKRLPMSSDLDDLIRRDDALYDLAGAGDAQQRAPRLRGAAALDALAAGPAPALLEHDQSDQREPTKVTSGRAAPEGGKAASTAKDGEDKPKQGNASAAPAEGHGNADEGDQQDDDGGENEDVGDQDGEAEGGDGEDGNTEDEIARIIEEIGETPKGIDAEDIDQVYTFREGLNAAARGIARKAIPGPLRADGREKEAEAWQAGHDLGTARKRAQKEG